MLVSVKMRQRDARVVESLNLRRQLLFDLRERYPSEQAGDDERFPRPAETSIVCDQGRYSMRREGGCAVHEREVRADAQRWKRTGATNSVSCGRGIRKQTGACHDPEFVNVEDSFIDANGEPEIVSIHDKPTLHGYLPAIRNTWTASTPRALNCIQGCSRARNCSTSARFSNVACSS